MKIHQIVPGLLLIILCACDGGPSQDYRNQKLDFESRAEDLVSRMTLEEKVSQLTNYAKAIDRLDVPRYNWWNECLHGVARAGEATVFPQAIGMAATFDRDMMRKMAEATSDEARAKYNDFIRRDKREMYQGLTFWSPNINIFRDPRWGRGHETYGEDPYLTGEMAVEFIRGLQGEHPRYLKTVATAKHYAVHSGPESSRHELMPGSARGISGTLTSRLLKKPWKSGVPGRSCAPITVTWESPAAAAPVCRRNC